MQDYTHEMMMMTMKTTNIYWVLVAGPTLNGLHALSHLILSTIPWCGGGGNIRLLILEHSKAKENRRQKYQRINAITQANREFLFTRAAESLVQKKNKWHITEGRSNVL